VGPAQRRSTPRVEGPAEPRAAVAASAYPMGAKDRLDRRNQGTEEVAAAEQEADNPIGMVMLAFAVDFRQVVDLDPTYSPIHRSAPR
jgi:hypothetical protein